MDASTITRLKNGGIHIRAIKRQKNGGVSRHKTEERMHLHHKAEE
jgi:hypothetical protein